MRSHEYRAWIVGSATGTTVKHTSPSRIEGFQTHIPPLEEQRAIAHILGTLDDKIELNRRRNQTLEAMARALFQDWFVHFGPVRAKTEGRQPYLPADLWQLFPDRLGDEGKPEGWKMQPLSELLTIIGGGTPKTSVDEYWNGDIPWFSVMDTPSASEVFVVATEKCITAYGLAGSSARLIPKGTTIISARGTVGNLAIAGREMTFNQSCYGLRGVDGAGDYFVYLTAQKMVSQLKSMAHGSVFSTITLQTFEAIQRPVPSSGVLAAFEGLVTGWFDAMLSNVEESRSLAQLRDTLLPRLISGQLRIADAEKFVETCL
jgi:type I restriction enzyme S subunit